MYYLHSEYGQKFLPNFSCLRQYEEFTFDGVRAAFGSWSANHIITYLFHHDLIEIVDVLIMYKRLYHHPTLKNRRNGVKSVPYEKEYLVTIYRMKDGKN